ncbi:glycosyltransferase family 4 protein [Clostridium perfringens]|nr:glycosyltransferase family 4 protein [Clostridium perfringens]
MKKILMVGASRKMKGGIATVVNSYYKLGLDKEVELTYLETICEGNKLFRFKKFCESIIYILKNIKNYDIVHIHMASRGSFLRKSILLLIAKYFNKKVVIHMHGAEFMIFYEKESNKIYQRYIRYILDKSDCIFALSDKWKENLGEITNIKKIKVINNSIIIPNKKDKKYNKNIMLFLGRVGERKGIFDILDVIPNIVKENDDLKFIIGGDGEVDKAIEVCKKNNIDKYVEFVGWVDGNKKENLLKLASIYILPSYNEGMPMSILEAMSYSIPIISTYVGGIPELIKNGKEGILINAGNKYELEEAIKELINSEEKKSSMGKCARKKVEDEFDLRINLQKILEEYNNLLEK